MAKVETYEGLLDQAHTNWNKIVYDIADRAFREVVKPFLKKHGYKFVAGNGTYIFTDADGLTLYEIDDWEHGDDEEKRHVYAVLAIIPDGFVHELGTIMSEYSGPKARNNAAR